jgi:uncharacterized protein
MDNRATPNKLNPVIVAMVNRIAGHYKPDKIVLFGSHGRGDAHADSDVDLLVIMPLTQSRRRISIEMYGLLAGMGLPKDVLLATPEEVEAYKDIPGTIIYPALKEGITLYERN